VTACGAAARGSDNFSMSGLGDSPPAMPDPTENSPKSCLAFSAAERADANPAQDALTQIPAVRRPAIISFAIWTCDRRAVTDAEKYFERGKDATKLYNTVKKKPSEQRKFGWWRDVIKHGENPKAGRIGNLSLLAIERSAENRPAQRTGPTRGPPKMKQTGAIKREKEKARREKQAQNGDVVSGGKCLPQSAGGSRNGGNKAGSPLADPQCLAERD